MTSKFLTQWIGSPGQDESSGTATYSVDSTTFLELKLPSFRDAHSISLALEFIESQARYAGRQEMKAAITNTMKNL